jgi:hypothetical protein
MGSLTKAMLVAMLYSAGVCQAVEPLPEALKPCLSMRRDAERLACYDRAIALIWTGSASTAAPSAENMFGANSSVDEQGKAAGEPERQELQQISGRVTSLHRAEDGMIVLMLDNDQVWRQQDKDTTLIIDAGDSVTIARASLGTFRITDKRGHSARFKRVR